MSERPVGGTGEQDFDSFTADEWESWLRDHQDHVLLFIDEDHAIHSMEWDEDLTFLVGGSYGYDYEGSRAAMEQFAQEDGDAFKVIPEAREHEERRKLKDGHWDTPSEWAGDDAPEVRADGGEPQENGSDGEAIRFDGKTGEIYARQLADGDYDVIYCGASGLQEREPQGSVENLLDLHPHETVPLRETPFDDGLRADGGAEEVGGGQTGASHPSDGYKLTVPKSEAEYVPSWAEDFEAGDTIRWQLNNADAIQESEMLGFSSRSTPSLPVIPATDVDDSADDGDTAQVPKRNWVPDDADHIADIELEYRQRMRVSIPVGEMPADENGALGLVENADPEFVADALPSSFDQAVSDGEFEVVSLSEERDSDE